MGRGGGYRRWLLKRSRSPAAQLARPLPQGNWWASYSDTKQPLFPSEDCVKDVRGQATMPWCACMVGKGSC